MSRATAPEAKIPLHDGASFDAAGELLHSEEGKSTEYTFEDCWLHRVEMCMTDSCGNSQPVLGWFPSFNCPGDCCEAHDNRGCNDPIVTDCVCHNQLVSNNLPTCCNDEWTQACADMVDDGGVLACGSCPD